MLGQWKGLCVVCTMARRSRSPVGDLSVKVQCQNHSWGCPYVAMPGYRSCCSYCANSRKGRIEHKEFCRTYGRNKPCRKELWAGSSGSGSSSSADASGVSSQHRVLPATPACCLLGANLPVWHWLGGNWHEDVIHDFLWERFATSCIVPFSDVEMADDVMKEWKKVLRGMAQAVHSRTVRPEDIRLFLVVGQHNTRDNTEMLRCVGRHVAARVEIDCRLPADQLDLHKHETDWERAVFRMRGGLSADMQARAVHQVGAPRLIGLLLELAKEMRHGELGDMIVLRCNAGFHRSMSIAMIARCLLWRHANIEQCNPR